MVRSCGRAEFLPEEVGKCHCDFSAVCTFHSVESDTFLNTTVTPSPSFASSVSSTYTFRPGCTYTAASPLAESICPHTQQAIEVHSIDPRRAERLHGQLSTSEKPAKRAHRRYKHIHHSCKHTQLFQSCRSQGRLIKSTVDACISSC